MIIFPRTAPMPRNIKTTVVGSYPVLPWMIASPSRPVLRDAVMTVLKTQELAGLDLITDGELTRFDPSNPEANGMVDYFVSRLSGIRNTFSPADLRAISRRPRLRLSPSHSRRRHRQDRRRHAQSSPRLRIRQRPYQDSSEVHLHRSAHARAPAHQRLL